MNLLVCKPLSWLTPEQAAKTKSIQTNCSKCQQKVWMVPRNKLLQADIACVPCAELLVKEAGKQGEEVNLQMAKTAVDRIIASN